MKAQKRGIPARYLKHIFKSLPNITDSQLVIIRATTDKKTYKTLSKLSGLISGSIIRDLEKETSSFMQMATELKESMNFDDLIEETK